jgi:hypothetical protein
MMITRRSLKTDTASSAPWTRFRWIGQIGPKGLFG